MYNFAAIMGSILVISGVSHSLEYFSKAFTNWTIDWQPSLRTYHPSWTLLSLWIVIQQLGYAKHTSCLIYGYRHIFTPPPPTLLLRQLADSCSTEELPGLARSTASFREHQRAKGHAWKDQAQCNARDLVDSRSGGRRVQLQALDRRDSPGVGIETHHSGQKESVQSLIYSRVALLARTDVAGALGLELEPLHGCNLTVCSVMLEINIYISVGHVGEEGARVVVCF